MAEHGAAARELCGCTWCKRNEAAPLAAGCRKGIAGRALEATDLKWREHWDQAIRERDSARQEVVAANSVDYWAWQQDGGNHLESMGEGMVVQMTAGNLRAMLEATEKEGFKQGHRSGVIGGLYCAQGEITDLIQKKEDAG